MESITGGTWHISHDRYINPNTGNYAGGRFLCSKYPVLWDEVISGNSNATLIDLPNSVSEKDLLVVNVHFRADNAVSSTAEWLRDFLDGKVVDVPNDAMIMITGDFNEQPNKNRYNAIMSANPNSPLNYTPNWTDLASIHLGWESTEGTNYTIGGVAFQDGNPIDIYKKRIDYMFWKSDDLKVKHAHILNTLIMNQSTLNNTLCSFKQQ